MPPSSYVNAASMFSILGQLCYKAVLLKPASGAQSMVGSKTVHHLAAPEDRTEKPRRKE